jgi:hypothetical protein
MAGENTFLAWLTEQILHEVYFVDSLPEKKTVAISICGLVVITLPTVSGQGSLFSLWSLFSYM